MSNETRREYFREYRKSYIPSESSVTKTKARMKAYMKDYVKSAESKAKTADRQRVRRSTPEYKERSKQWSRQHYQRNIEKRRQKNLERMQDPNMKQWQREYMLRKRYGLDQKGFEVLSKSQSDRCALCKREFGLDKDNKPHVDHDHKSGKVRSLLCHACNCGLGQFRDNSELLREAAEYIERHRDENLQ